MNDGDSAGSDEPSIQSNKSDLDEETKHMDVKDPKKFKVLPLYDGGFLKRGRVTTLTELIESREANQASRLTMDSFGKSVKRQNKGVPFLYMLVLRITVPSNKTSDTPFPFKKNRFDKKPIQRATYKKCILFADLADADQLTGVILEETNEDHNRLFSRDMSLDDVAVGARCAIMAPRVEGNQLKNGAWVITTNRPLEFLAQPGLPSRPLRSERIGHEIRYYVIKNTKIMLLDDDVIDPVQTKCNFHSCDRYNAKSIGNQSCGCWVQNKRGENGPRNTVLMFSFYFQDSNSKIVRAADFTSLRTSKLFFRGSNILADAKTLQKNDVYDYMQEKWRDSVEHINNNGGWTIVGWYIRATIEEEEKEESDETLLRTNVKINVSYLYPSTKTGRTIPDDSTIAMSEIKGMTNPSDETNASSVNTS